MTEDEAKTKVCPFDLGQHATGYTTECFQHGDSIRRDYKRLTSNCIGSDCMAWRWNYLMRVQQIGHGPGAASTAVEDTTQFSGGYCGLAGKP